MFVGYDLARDAIERAWRGCGTRARNASFELMDITTLMAEPPFDLVLAFNAIHDQRDPSAFSKKWW